MSPTLAQSWSKSMDHQPLPWPPTFPLTPPEVEREGEAFSVSFSVPGNPRGKGRPRTAVIAGRAQIYTDAKTRSEEGAVRMFAMEAMGGRPPYEGPVVLRICAYRKMPTVFSQKKRVSAERGAIAPITKPDFDNCSKLAADALNGIVIHDDAQVVSAVIHKRYSANPRLVVSVISWVG
jgi:Holliday junction resolvase RusA-like endonuclease